MIGAIIIAIVFLFAFRIRFERKINVKSDFGFLFGSVVSCWIVRWLQGLCVWSISCVCVCVLEFRISLMLICD